MPRLVLFLLAVPLGGIGCGVSIHDAAANGDIGAVSRMLERGHSLLESRNALGKTPLFYAVTYGQPEVVAFLLERGAAVNAADKTGMTPLHAAATLSRTDEAQLLLRHGAALEARDVFGDTPFHLAAVFGQPDMLRWLAQAGADIRSLNDANLSPLESALRQHKNEAADTIRQLLETGK